MFNSVKNFLKEIDVEDMFFGLVMLTMTHVVLHGALYYFDVSLISIGESFSWIGLISETAHGYVMDYFHINRGLGFIYVHLAPICAIWISMYLGTALQVNFGR